MRVTPRTLLGWTISSGMLLCGCSQAPSSPSTRSTNGDSAASASGVNGFAGARASAGSLAPGSLPRAGAGGSLGAAGSLGAGSIVAANGGRSGASMGTAGAPSRAPLAGAGAVIPVGGAGATGAAGANAVTDPSQCPAPDPTSTPESITALNEINKLRVAMGNSCATNDVLIAKAAANHCAYYITNNTSNPMCTSNPHLEVSGCTGFTGMLPYARMMAAGWKGNGGGAEVMYFVDDPKNAVATWANSVGHRVTMLDPATGALGYGNGMGCDTMDFGSAVRSPTSTLVVYPYDGQTGLPTAFAGGRESPMPPVPASGWPSGSPITIYAQKAMITEHVLTVDGDTTPIDHVWLDSTSAVVADADRAGYANNPFLYANKPLTPNTKYHVKISGTYAGGSLAKEWTFTTGVGNPNGT
jgi:uncharacterized protein YkwD